MKEKIKIIAIFGKSGSGKDTIQKWLVNNGYGCGIVSHTTRPPRDYEKDGIDYHFITNYKFAEKIYNGDMLEATEFNNWMYGTSIEALSKDKINIGVFNPDGIRCLLDERRIEVLPIYIVTSDKIRLLRNLKREKEPNCSEICRRFFTDDKDFQNIEFEYLYFDNNKKRTNFETLINKIKKTGFLNKVD